MTPEEKSSRSSQLPEAWIAGASDHNYAMPLAVTLYSALHHASPNYHWRILILDSGLTADDRARLIRVVSQSKASATIEIIQPDASCFEGIDMYAHLSIGALYRLLLPKILKKRTERVIYLDCDLLVLADVSQLWEIDFEGTPALAVQGYGSPYVSDFYGVPTWKEQGLDPQTPCLNSGVLVMNLPLWDQHDIGGKVTQYIRQYNDLRVNDQHGINAILAGNWKKLDPRWNQMNTINRFESWPDNDFKEAIRKQYEDILNHPFIVHFTGPTKPWMVSSPHPRRQQYHEYLHGSAWFSSNLEYRQWLFQNHFKKLIDPVHKLRRILSKVRKRVL